LVERDSATGEDDVFDFSGYFIFGLRGKQRLGSAGYDAGWIFCLSNDCLNTKNTLVRLVVVLDMGLN